MEQNVDERLQKAAEEYINLPHSCLWYSDDGWEDKTDWEYIEKAFKAGAQWGMKDAIKNATTEELKAELKKRAELAKAQKAEEMKNALMCRNCKHCVPHPSSYVNMFLCNARTWGKTYPRHYCVKLHQKACDKFERKIEE